MTAADDELVAWLLEGDPSIRWRVHRDLLGSPASTVDAERARVATEGWGAKLISLQDPDGRWGGGDYSPKWTSTTYTLLHLVWLGLPPRNSAALAGCERLWEWQSRWRVPETCIASILVRLTAAHGYGAERLDDVVGYLLGQQLNDGGWNCAARGDPGKHSSFHTSILALEALDAYQRAVAERPLMRRRHEGGSSSCGISCTSPIAPARWQSVAAPASLSCPSGTLTFCAGWSTLPTRAPPGTNGWATPSQSCGVPVERTVGGRRTPPIPAGHGSGWRNRVRAGGTPRECCASWTGGTQPAELLAADLRHLPRA